MHWETLFLLTLLTVYFSSQTSLLSSMNLHSELSISLTPSPPSIPSQDSISSVGAAYQQDYMPLFTEQIPPSTASAPVMPPPTPLPPPISHSLQCQAVVPRSLPSAVVTHTGSCSVTPSTTATQRSTFALSPRPSLQDQALPCISLPPQPQSFALPRPIQPAGSAKKSRHVPIVPVTPSHLILTGDCLSPQHMPHLSFLLAVSVPKSGRFAKWIQVTPFHFPYKHETVASYVTSPFI